MKKSLFLAMAIMALFTACSSDDGTTNEEPLPTNPNQEKYVSAKINSGTTITLRKIDFLDSNLGYIAGGNPGTNAKAIILKTTDGGESWSKIFEKDGYYVTSIHAVSAQKVVAVTNNGIILSSVDAGANWSENLTYKDTFYMADIQFTNENSGYVTGSNPGAGGVFLSTSNKGATWVEKDYLDIPQLGGIMLTTIAFSGTTIYFAGGTFSEGTLMKSGDNGASWSKSTIAPNTLLTDILLEGNNGFATASNGISDGQTEKGQLLKTTDAGANWTTVATGFDNKMKAVAQKGNAICIVVAQRWAIVGTPGTRNSCCRLGGCLFSC